MSSAARRRLPSVVKALGAVSFCNDLASEMIYPLIPALVTRGLGGGALALGVFDGVAEAVSAAFKLASGRLADRRGWRRPLVITGYAVAAVARPVMGVAVAAWQVIGLRAADRLGKGVRTPPRDAVIADAATPEIRGRAFGFHRGMDHAGAIAGPLAAWALLDLWRWAPERVIVWSAVPGLLAVALAAWALRRSRDWETGRTGAEEVPRAAAVRPAAAGAHGDPRRSLLPLVFVFAFIRLPETLLLLRLQDLGVPIALVPLLWAALHLVRTAASYPGGWLSDVIGPHRTMLAGWAIYAVVCAGMGAASTGREAAAWFFAFGLVAAATEAPERALVAALGGAAKRGRQFGMYHAGVGIVALPGAVLLGAVYQEAGGGWALGASGAVAAALVAWGAIAARRPRFASMM